MIDFPRYPEIVLLDKRPELMAVKEVVAHEKIHGSNFRVHLPLGMSGRDEIGYGSREVVYDTKAPGFPLMHGVNWFRSRPETLTRIWEVVKAYGFPDATLFGELHGPGVQAKGVTYSDGKHALFRAFDLMVGPNFVTYDLFVELMSEMKLQTAPLVYRGPPSKGAFDALLEQRSMVAAENGVAGELSIAEGVIVRSAPLLRNVFGEWLIAKHKAAKFREVAEVPKEAKPRGAGPADDFAATFVTEGRIGNAVARLVDRGGVLKGSMADMPTLITEIVADLHKEHNAAWKATGLADKALPGAVSKVTAPIYRQMIALPETPGA